MINWTNVYHKNINMYFIFVSYSNNKKKSIKVCIIVSPFVKFKLFFAVVKLIAMTKENLKLLCVI